MKKKERSQKAAKVEIFSIQRHNELDMFGVKSI